MSPAKPVLLAGCQAKKRLHRGTPVVRDQTSIPGCATLSPAFREGREQILGGYRSVRFTKDGFVPSLRDSVVCGSSPRASALGLASATPLRGASFETSADCSSMLLPALS